jgi:mono/diheme cytochrome c family protein
MTWRVILGTISLVVTTILLGYVAVTEPDRMAGFEQAYDARQVENGAAIFESNCSPCHGRQGEGGPRAPALNAPDLLAPNSPRLTQINWAGSTENYIRSAIAGGRPRASSQFTTYPERMPTWGEEYGGPLRTDQVDSLVAFIMNWAPAFVSYTPQPTPTIIPVGVDITVELPAGDAANGRLVSERVGIACNVCHTGAALVGPAWLAEVAPDGKGVGTHAEERLSDPGYTGQATTPEQYLFESIVQPSVYIVPGGTYATAEGVSLMPGDLGQKLTGQDVADLIAYLRTLR